MSGMRSFKNRQIQHDGGKTPELSGFQHQIGDDNSFGGEKRARNFLKMGAFGLALVRTIAASSTRHNSLSRAL